MKRKFTTITRFVAALALLCMAGAQIEERFSILLLLSMLVLMGFFRWIRPDLGWFMRRLQPLNASDGAWPKPIQRLLPFCCAVLPMCAALVLPISSAQAQGCLSLDSWLVAQSLGGVGGPTSSVVTGAGILGGERDMVLSNMTPADGNGIRAESVPTFFAGFPVLEMENASGRFSTLTVTWDGSDGDASALNTTGLNGVNLMANGATGFFSTINLDGMPGTGDLSVTIQIYDMVGGVSSVTINVPPANSTTVPFNAPFSAFSAGANFAQVGAIVLTVNMQNRNGWDVYMTEMKLDCCPSPTATAAATQPSCSGAGAPNNGGITINGFTNERYQYSAGATFNSGAAIPASITAIPVGGVIASTLANTTQQYTVRIYDATNAACYVDRVVSITAANCPPPCALTVTPTTPLCHGNGTPEVATDDYFTFIITVTDALPTSNTFTITATQGGNPITILLANGSPATAVRCGIPTPLRTATGRAGQGNIVVTVTDNTTNCTQTVNITDPGTCAVTCTPGTPSMVMYSYRTQTLVTELENTPIIIPQFDEMGGTRTLTSVKLEYGSGGYFSMLTENSAVQAQTFEATSSTDSEIRLNSNLLATLSLSATTGEQTLPAGISVPAQGSWPGDIMNSTIEGMRSWAQDIMGNLKDPRSDSRWVTTATGNATHDDDIHYMPVTQDEETGMVTYTMAPDLLPFKGSGNVPLDVSTLSSFLVQGGGGNISSFQATRGYAFAKVTYTYECAAVCINPSGITFTQTAPTCNVAVANNNGIITFATATNATNFGISTAGAVTYDGPAYPATTFTGVGQDVSIAIPNTGGTYIVRVFNGAADCYLDVPVMVAPVNCSCPTLAVSITESNVNVCGPGAATFNYTVTNGPAIITTSNGTIGNFSTTTLNNGTGTFTYTPAAGEIGTVINFTATIADPDGTGPCNGASDNAAVTSGIQPEAGTGGPTTICETSTTTISLFSLITGGDAGGTWTAGVANPAGGTFIAGTGTFNPTGATPGVYTFTYAFAAGGGCAADQTTVTVNVTEQKDAGDNGSTNICVASTTSITIQPTDGYPRCRWYLDGWSCQPRRWYVHRWYGYLRPYGCKRRHLHLYV